MAGQRSIVRGIVLVLAQGLSGCGDSGSLPAPSAPSALPQSSPIQQLVVFTDPASGFATSDTRDIDEQIVQFTRAGELIWTRDDTRFPGYRPYTSFNYITADAICLHCSFEIRFGIKDGERRAYLTFDYHHDNPGTVVDLEVVDGKLIMTKTSVGPPGTYTLSGRIFEATPTGPAPVEGVTLHSLNQYVNTDKNGFYRMPGLYAGIASVWAGKEGYQSGSRDVTINGDTKLDIHIIRR